ncbi:MAG: RagB/SusD family nutrient uptake outer membrane protein [bacterium]
MKYSTMMKHTLIMLGLALCIACSETEELIKPLQIDSQTFELPVHFYEEYTHGYNLYLSASNGDSIYLKTLGKITGNYSVVERFHESENISVVCEYIDVNGKHWLGKAGYINIEKDKDNMLLTFDIAFENDNSNTSRIVLSEFQKMQFLNLSNKLETVDQAEQMINEIITQLAFNCDGELESSLLLNYFYASDLITPFVKADNNYSLAREFDEVNYTPENKLLLPLWLDSYSFIDKINSLLIQLNAFNTREKEIAEGKLKFLRAYIYFLLFDSFYNVPPITNSLIYSIPDNYYPDDVLNLMEQDIKESIPLLPNDTPTNRIMFNKDAAKLLLARINLIRGDLDEALIVEEIIYSNKYDLSESYSDIFKNENNKELIWILPLPHENEVSISEMMKDLGSLAKEDLNYESIDIRKPNTLEYNLISKFYRVPFLPVFRYSEVLLIAAEVHLRKANYHQALNYLNEIRARANLANLEFSSELTLKDSIFTEAVREFVLEGQNFMNIKKYNYFEILVDPQNYKSAWPIPKVLPNISLGIYQNPGYRIQ